MGQSVETAFGATRHRLSNRSVFGRIFRDDLDVERLERQRCIQVLHVLEEDFDARWFVFGWERTQEQPVHPTAQDLDVESACEGSPGVDRCRSRCIARRRAATRSLGHWTRAEAFSAERPSLLGRAPGRPARVNSRAESFTGASFSQALSMA